MDDYLPSIYYHPKRSGGFGGVGRLYQDVKKEGKFKISRKEIKAWLMKQDAYTLHKPMRRHFKRNRVIVGGIDQQWKMDLADMQSMQKFNDGYRYLLVCIDVFSKYAWVVPLKNKAGPDMCGSSPHFKGHWQPKFLLLISIRYTYGIFNFIFWPVCRV
jgi:hypothetical protein